MNVAVAVASKHGSTREIAEALARGLTERGLTAEALDIGDLMTFEGYDAVVLGSAVYAGHWMRDARHASEVFETQLEARPVWLFSSGPIGAEHPLPDGGPADVDALLERTGALGHEVFAGKLDDADLGFIERSMVHALHAETGDFRDWDAIDAYAAQIAAVLTAAPATRS